MKILLIEDNPVYLDIMTYRLEKHEVTHAESIASALDLLEELELDLIICDYNLPDSNGDAGIESIKELTSVPLIVISSGWNNDKKDDLLLKGFSIVDKCRFDNYNWG